MKKPGSTAVDAERLETLLSAVERMAGGDLDAEIPTYGKRDDLDAIAAGINILAGELRYTTVSKQYLDSILDAMADPLIVVDGAGVIQTVNNATRKLLGYSDDALIDRPLSAIFASPDADHLEDSLRQVSSQARSWLQEGELQAHDDQLIPVAITASPLDPARSESGQVVCVARDLRATRRLHAEREELEAQLHRAQKMEALGRLAGGIAHDFNNVLTAIISYAEFLEEALEEGDPRRDDATGILSASERAERLIRQLLAFARSQPLEPRAVVVDDLIRDIREMFERVLGGDVELVTQLASDDARVRMDPGQLEQVLTNLVINARHAMVDGGTLTIVTTEHSFGEEDARLKPGIKPGPYVCIQVIDNGIGMTEEVKARLFEPFFTTRDRGEGTGLGLATCYGIVKQAGGVIEVVSAPGKGTTFLICLPRAAATAIKRPSRKDHQKDLRGTETILLVEDEDAVRDLAARALRGLGYTVVTAADGMTALRELDRLSPGAIDLVVTDVMMPQMGGPELASRIRAVFPDMTIVFMSGYTGDSELAEEIRTSRFFLPKPFASLSLVRHVRSVLDDSG